MWLTLGEVGERALAGYFSPVNPWGANKQNSQPRGLTKPFSGPLGVFLGGEGGDGEEGVGPPLCLEEVDLH